MPDWPLMTAYLVHHLLMFAIVAALFLYPIGRILSRIGLSPLWSIFAVNPLVNLIFLRIVAFIDWPQREQKPVP